MGTQGATSHPHAEKSGTQAQAGARRAPTAMLILSKGLGKDKGGHMALAPPKHTSAELEVEVE